MEESIGNAYLTVKAEPDSGMQSTLEAAGGKGGKGFGGAFSVAAGNLMSTAVQALASFAVDAFSQAFSNYADYQQLVGGVDTLFKESSSVVQENAAQAFRTAGLSANEYMETVTSFSASLLQSLGGDTEKAASIADKAIVDMADNANKMGTSMESIQNAYQGFAKQNYTMLDNLKLGYGGTKQEMERLLADASKIAGVEFNIDSYADVIEAIHVMQETMGIAGTTMEEGSATISGSINQLQSAWSNFLTGLFDENADMDALTDQLITSLGTVVENVLPAVGTLFAQLGRLIMQAIGNAILEFGTFIAEGFMTVFDAAGTAITEWLAAAGTAITDVWNGILSFLGGIWDGITSTVSNAVSSVQTAVTGAFEAVSSTVTSVFDAILSTATTIWEGVKSAIETPLNAARGIVEGFASTIQGIIGGLNLNLPHFALPHFRVSGGEFPWGIGGAGYPPEFGVDWYAKGGYVEDATLIGAGERGGELIWPSYEPYLSRYADAIASKIGAGGVDIHDCTFNVRQESDIRRVAVELNTIINRQMAGGIA